MHRTVLLVYNPCFRFTLIFILWLCSKRAPRCCGWDRHDTCCMPELLPGFHSLSHKLVHLLFGHLYRATL